MPYLYLLRHGEILNREHRFIGQLDAPLSGKGIAQSEKWAYDLASTRFAQIWSSDLSRCRVMAELIAAKHNLSPQFEPDFREINLGLWQGLNKIEVENKFPGALAQRKNDFWNYIPAGGESFAMLSRRVLVSLRSKLINKALNGDILLVAHSAVMRVLLLRYCALGPKDLFKINIPYAACFKLEYSADFLQKIKES